MKPEQQRKILEASDLRRIIMYNVETGDFFWIVTNSNRAKAGTKACASINSNGYAEIKINNVQYKAHRLAWLYVYGWWPDQIDHINGVRTDNRICNLRSVNPQINAHNQRRAHKNNAIGVLGVFRRPSGRFAAEIRVDGKKLCLGTYDTVEEASAVYCAKKLELHIGAV